MSVFKQSHLYASLREVFCSLGLSLGMWALMVFDSIKEIPCFAW